jgi:hypothetical protein
MNDERKQGGFDSNTTPLSIVVMHAENPSFGEVRAVSSVLRFVVIGTYRLDFISVERMKTSLMSR